MADVDITSLSVEISAESQGAELNIDKLADAIANLRNKGNVSAVCDSLDKLAGSISGLKSASKGIGSLFKNIEKMSNIDVSGIDFTGLSGKLESLKSELQPLQNLDASGLKAVGSAMNAIAKIPSINDKLDAETLDKFKKSCDSIASSLTPLASQLDKVGNAFAKLPPQLSKVVTQANRVTAANEKQKKSYLSLSAQLSQFQKNMAKLVSIKAIADYLGNAVAKFNDFYEATDLFHNAMGNLSGEADTLISKMQGLLGVDPTKAMTYMATIQSLGTSFGLTSDKAYILSKNLTQLAYDEASYWNKGVTETFTAMSSAISGEIEPIRRLGVDLTQARLQQELLALGFNKQVSSLSQADKAVLRYIAIMKQTANVQGNLAQTINSPANQIKILKAQLDMLAKSVGSLLYPALKSILPPLIAAVQLIREFVEWVAKLMGVKVVFTDFTKSADSVGGIGDAMDDTADSTKKAAKALKDYTMGFDELNIIDPTQGSSGSGSGASAGNILGDVDLSGYDMFKDYVGTSIDEMKQKIKSMLPLIATVTTALAAWKLTNLITDIVDAIAKMNALKSIILGLGVFTVGIVLEITGIKDAIENGVNGKNFAEIVLGALIGTTGAAILGKGIAQFIVTGFGNTAVGAAIKAAGGSTAGAIIGAAVGGVVTGIPMFVTGVYDAVKNGLNTLNGILIPLGSTMAGAGIGAIIGSLGGPIGTGVGALIGLIVGALTDVGIAIYQNWDKIAESLDKASESLKNWFVGVGEWWDEKWQGFSTNFQTAWESLPEFVQHPIQALDQASAGLKQWFVGVGEWWNQKWEGFEENWGKSWNSLKKAVGSFSTSMDEKTKKVVDSINTGLDNARQKMDEKIGPFADSFRSWIDGLSAENAEAKLKEIGSSISTKFDSFASSVIQKKAEASAAMGKWIEGLRSGVNEKIESVREKIGEITSAIENKFKNFSLFDIGKNLIQGLVDGVNNMIETAKDAVANVGNAVIDKVKNVLGIHSPSTVFAEIGDFLMQGLVQGVEDAKDYVNTAFNVMGAQAVNAAVTGLGLDTGKFNTMGQEAGIDTAAGLNAQVPTVAGFFNSAATYFGTNFWVGLDDTWAKIDNAIKTDTIGSIQTLFTAIKNGDLSSIAKWSASYFYAHLSAEQKTQIQTFAQSALAQLGGSLSGVFQNLSGLARSFVSLFVPAATAATTSQVGLNVAMDANPIMLLISLIGMLAGAFINFSGTNQDVGNSFKKVWINVKIFFSYVMEEIAKLSVIPLQALVSVVNGIIKVYNKIAKWVPGISQKSLITTPYDYIEGKFDKDRAKWKQELSDLDKKQDLGSADNTDYDSKYQELLKEQEERANELKKQFENSTPSLDNSSTNSAYKQQIEALQKQLEDLRNKMGQTATGSLPSWNPSNYPGTKEWDKDNNWSSGTVSGGTTTVKIDETEMRESVYNGTYNAFLDIFQRYGDELTGGKELKIYLDGKQITASVEKRQNARGMSLMGSEVYSY